jgi:hypothetical protein
MWCGWSSGLRRRRIGSSGRVERSCVEVFGELAVAVVGAVAEELDVVLAKEEDEEEDEVDESEVVTVGTEGSDAGSAYPNPKSSSSIRSGNLISVV